MKSYKKEIHKMLAAAEDWRIQQANLKK